MTVQTESREGLEPPVEIWVRRGESKDERYITFIIPNWLSQGEILDRNWAVDGNQVLFTVKRTELYSAEMDLVEFFRMKGNHPITFC